MGERLAESTVLQLSYSLRLPKPRSTHCCVDFQYETLCIIPRDPTKRWFVAGSGLERLLESRPRKGPHRTVILTVSPSTRDPSNISDHGDCGLFRRAAGITPPPCICSVVACSAHEAACMVERALKAHSKTDPRCQIVAPSLLSQKDPEILEARDFIQPHKPGSPQTQTMAFLSQTEG